MKRQPPFQCHAVYPWSKSKRCWFNSGHTGHHETTFYGRIVTWSALADTTRRLCPVHGIPDCSPLLNGCSRLVGSQ